MFVRLIGWCCLLFSLSVSAATTPTILVFGDSLSAGYGIDVEKGWVALLRQRLQQSGYPYRVVNASISGETSAGGLQRLPAALQQHHPQIVLIELGANDGLRGLPIQAMRGNLTEMIRLSRAQQARPVLFEMRIPANYGGPYGAGFHAAFGDLSRTLKVPLVPFWLAAIATDPAAFQDDGIHPNLASQPKLLDAVWPTLQPLLRRSR